MLKDTFSHGELKEETYMDILLDAILVIVYGIESIEKIKLDQVIIAISLGKSVFNGLWIQIFTPL